jgi:lysyl-tRNA synthetase class 2
VAIRLVSIHYGQKQLQQFVNKASEYAWTPAVMGATERGGEVWIKETKMLAFDYGDEAIIDVKSFTIEGKIMGNVRHMVNRTKTRWIHRHNL